MVLKLVKPGNEVKTIKDLVADQQDFDFHLNKFIALAQDVINEHFKEGLPSLPPGKLKIHPGGRRYIRIVNAGSVYCFVDRTNGDVLKAASWIAPAKRARGNIFNHDNGL